jgi:hypothetical protein
MRVARAALLSAALLGALQGCATLAEYGNPAARRTGGAAPPGAPAPAAAAAPAEGSVVQGKGTVQWVEEEGGFWGLRADDGRRYRVPGLEPVWRKQGTRVRFEGRVRSGAPATRAWEAVLELTSVRGA